MAVSLELAKQHMRVETADEDEIIGVYLAASKAWVEGYTETKLERGAVTVELQSLVGTILLDAGPNPDNALIVYIDVNGDPQTITDAVISGNRLSLAQSWPATQQGTPIFLTYDAGYGSVPADLDLAVLLLAGEYRINREASTASPAVIASVEALCRPYRPVRV